MQLLTAPFRFVAGLPKKIFGALKSYEYIKEATKFSISFFGGGCLAIVLFWISPPIDRRSAVKAEITNLIKSKWGPITSSRAFKIEPFYVSTSEDRIDGSKTTMAAANYTFTPPGATAFDGQGFFVGLYRDVPSTLTEYVLSREKMTNKLIYSWHLKGLDPDVPSQSKLALLPTAKFLSNSGGTDILYLHLVWMDKIDFRALSAPVLLEKVDGTWQQVTCTAPDRRTTQPNAFKRTIQVASYTDDSERSINVALVDNNTTFVERLTEHGWDILEFSEFISGAAVYYGLIVWNYNLGYCKQHPHWNGGYQLTADRSKLGPTRQAAMETLYQRGLNRSEPESGTPTIQPPSRR